MGMCHRAAILLGCLLGVLCAVAPARAALVGKVVHVGFPASIGDVVSSGAWAPVMVELALEGANSFDGFLRVSQRDKDGDLACDRVAVQLRADSGARRTYVLYCIVGPLSGAAGAISVDVLDQEGSFVEVVSEDTGKPTRSLRPAQMPERLGGNEYVILSLSDRGKGKLAYLDGFDQPDKFDRPIVVTQLAPADLPDRWQGLEMLDAIVWDAADATKLSPAQIEGLVTWVRHGGHLLIAASTTSDTLAQNKRLSAILPVKIGRVVPQETRLPNLRRGLLDDKAEPEDSRYSTPIPVALGQPVAGAETLAAERALDNATVAARRRLDRGTVMFVGATLADLMPEGEALKPVEFFKRTLRLRQPRAQGGTAPVTPSLFPVLEQTVGFRQSTGLYLLGAVLFSIIYVAVATFGSWWFLRSRGWTRHAWSAFAVVAGAAAALSLLVAQSMRGVELKLHQLTVVDATVGQAEATATAYFGVKTPTHSLLDVWMPSDYTQETKPERSDGYLKPLPSSVGDDALAGSSYSDPARYRLVPASALVEDVPVRATLKQFEGRWIGQLRRTIEAKVNVGPLKDETGQEQGILEGSTVTNKLGHPLRNCLLVQARRNAFLSNFNDISPRHEWILAHPVGDIADGETIDLAERAYADPQGIGQLSVEKWRARTLKEYHKQWGRKFQSSNPFGGGSDVVKDLRLEDYQDALLLMTLLGEHQPSVLTNTISPGGYDFDRRHLPQLDRSDELTTDRVLLIGFAEEQGPVMLCARSGRGEFKPQLADVAYTMYRFWIPVTPAKDEN